MRLDMSGNQNTFSMDVLDKTRDECLLAERVYDPDLPFLTDEERQKAKRFHEYIKERVKKMFTPFTDGENNVVIQQLPESFFDQFSFCYMDVNVPNACCYPKLHDDKVRIAITRDLLDMCENEDELMGIIGHEVGHCIHRYIKERTGNDMAEEAASDIIAMAHMRNAGYHPRNFQKIMRKIEAWANRHPKTAGDDAVRVFDVHPVSGLRNAVNDAWLTKHSVDHIGLTETALNTDVIQEIESLAVVERLTSFLDVEMTEDNFKRCMAQLKEHQVFVQAAQEGISGNFWSAIRNMYLKNEPAIDVQLVDETAVPESDISHVIGLLNPIYREKFVQRFSGLVSFLTVREVWDNAVDLYGEGNIYQEAYHLQTSLLNHVADYADLKYHYNKDTIGSKLFGGRSQELENALPEELKICRAYIWQLLTHPETITEESLQDERLQKPLKRLRNMLASEYMYFNTARFLLAPLLQVKKGRTFPLFDLIKQNMIPLDGTKVISELHQNPIRMLLSTLGFYDTNVFHYPSSDAVSARYNLLNSEALGVGEVSISMNDIRDFADRSCCITLSTRGCRKYYYDLNSGIVKDVEEHDIHFRIDEGAVLGGKIKVGLFSQQDTMASKREKEYIEPYYKDLFGKKTKRLHTLVHCDIKKRLDALEHRQPDIDMFEDVENLKAYILDGYSSGQLDFYKMPFLPQNMPWYFNVYGQEALDPTVVRQNQDIESKYPSKFLFDFTTQITIVDQILESYLRLSKAGLANPELAQKIVLSFKQCPYFLGDMSRWYETKECLVEKQGKKTKEKREEVLEHYVDRKYSRLFWQMFAQKPYIDFIDEDFFAHLPTVEIVKIYDEAPALLPKLFDFYRPAKTGADLMFMLQQYHRIEVDDKAWLFWKKEQFKMLFSHMIRDYVEQGNTDVPAEVFFHLGANGIYRDAPVDDLFKARAIKEGDIGLLHNYIDNLNRQENWNQNVKSAMRVMSHYADFILSSAERTELADFAPIEILNQYREILCAELDWHEKTNLLACVWGQRKGFNGSLSDDACHIVLGMDNEPHIWNKSVRENVHTYLWLVDKKAFPRNGVLQKQILNFVLEQLHKEPPQVQEELSFLLLTSRADVSFPSINQGLQDMWVKAVADIMGKPDDMSSQYLARLEPYIRKLKNKKSGRKKQSRKTKQRNQHQENGYIAQYSYSKLSPDTQVSLSKALQEALVSQEKLSFLLESNVLAGALSNKNKDEICIGGIALNSLLTVLSDNPSATKSFIDFLLHEPTAQRIKDFEQTIKDQVDSFSFKWIRADKIDFSVEYMQNIHDIFWNLPFESRTLILKSLFETAHEVDIFTKSENPNAEQMILMEQAQKERIEDMINRILPPNIENRLSFYRALKNYSTAVHEDEMYEADFLLAGCLAVQPKRENAEFSMAKTIRLFLESQGPAGIKVGQFLSAHDAISPEIRQELKQLTNHASCPSRAEVFRTIAEYHPELMDYIRQNGLGTSLGSASHYLTFELNDKEVVSVSRNQSALKAEMTYERLKKALQKTMDEDPSQKHLLLIIRDAIEQAHEMNDMELNANIGYIQMRLARRLYDHISMDIDGYHFTFKTMEWKKPTGAYHVRVQDFNTQYSQSYKIMERAHGYDYDALPLQTEEDRRYKKAVAKANFVLNLRTILSGNVFDDDRHTGQLKVQPVSDTHTRINLFDTGSMSIRTPRRAEMRLLGQALYKTMRALITLSETQQKDKLKILKSLFPQFSDIDKFVTVPKNELLSFCFNAAIHELRDEQTGRVPSYISKVERALANLTHFTADIPSEEIVPLALQLLMQKGNIHPDIVSGMGNTNFEFEQEIIQTLVPQGVLNIDLLEKETQHEDVPLTKAIHDVLTGAETLGKADKMSYTNALAKMLFIPKDVFPLDHIHTCMESVRNVAVRQRLSQNLCQLAKSFVQTLQSGKKPSDITKDVIGYLSETGLPSAFAHQVSVRLPIMQIPLFRIAFLHHNKLTFFEKPIQRMLTQTITNFADKWSQLQEQLMSFVQTTDKLSIGTVDTAHLKDCDLPTRTVKKDGQISNEVIKTIRGLRSQK